MMEQEILDRAGEQIAGQWQEQGAEARYLTESEDLYPADYAFAEEQLGRALSASERHDLRAIVGAHLAGDR